MKKVLIILALASLNCMVGTGQISSKFLISGNIEKGNRISSEYQPRITHNLDSYKIILDYSFFNWKHTNLRFGAGYQYLKCSSNSNLQYLLTPLVFQRFVNSNKMGFNYSIVVYPSFNLEDNNVFCREKTSEFHLQLAIRLGLVGSVKRSRFSIELELASIMDTIRKNTSTKFISYGVRMGYYIFSREKKKFKSR